jgi:transcriptional regulator with XRE-family HTH domain
MQGIKQTILAQEVGLSKSAIAKFESRTSSLSLTNLKKIASVLSINPDYLDNNKLNPFKSDKLIKMTLPPALSLKTDFSLIYFLAENNQNLTIAMLTPEDMFPFNILSDTIFAYPIYAIAVKDQDDNMFIFRKKEKSVYTAAITGEKKLELELNRIAKEQGKIMHVYTRGIDRTLYKKIQSWDDLTREDLNPLFNFSSDAEFHMINCKFVNKCIKDGLDYKDIFPELHNSADEIVDMILLYLKKKVGLQQNNSE